MTDRKVAFVTGASRGIGRSAALALADRGFDVVVAARTMKKGEGIAVASTVHDSRRLPVEGSLEETAAAVREKGVDALPVALDLLEVATIDQAVASALNEMKRIDVLVNNAIYQGVGTMDRLLDIPLTAMRDLFAANVVAQAQLVQLVLPGMVERGQGRILNLTSGSGQMDPPGPIGKGGWGFAYAASKAAFHRMAGILHVEHGGEGVAAFNVDPGYTPTAVMRAFWGNNSDLDENYGGAPPEVAGAVIAWLADDPDALELAGTSVNAQRLCRQRELLAGWPA